MTDNEIINALECCCKSNTNDYCCEGCTYESIGLCASVISKEAFDLINRQKAEIETIKETTIKAFAERLKRSISFLELPNVVVRGHIDNVVKEMTEGSKLD